jgi:hypothetical protein
MARPSLSKSAGAVIVEFRVEPKGASKSLQLFEVGGIGEPFTLSLPSRSAPLRALPELLPVQFTVLEEKFVGRTVHESDLTELSDFETPTLAVHAGGPDQTQDHGRSRPAREPVRRDLREGRRRRRGRRPPPLHLGHAGAEDLADGLDVGMKQA